MTSVEYQTTGPGLVKFQEVKGGKTMHDAENRRNKLVEILRESKGPVSGSKLSDRLGVSRQVIVQDVALLRAANIDVFATPKGYLLYERPDAKRFRRTFMVKHDRDQIEKELSLIVDNGGKVLNIVVPHDVYGQIQADLIIETRADIAVFYEKILNSKDGPLSAITGGVHVHLVEASSEKILDNIARDLTEAGLMYVVE